MADVTSTARLIVTVEGEDKIRKLLADLKKLGAAGGASKIGIGGGKGGLGSLAASTAATHVAVKRAIAPAIAAGVATAKVVEKTASQQASVAKTVATIGATQAVTGKLMGKIGEGQSVLAKAVAPLQTVTGGMAKAQAALAAVKGRAKELFPAQGPPATGITDKFIAAIRKRGALGTDEEIRQRYANPPAATIPLNKKELAKRAAMGLPPPGAAAGVAEGAAGAGGMGLAARLGVGAGVVTILGGAAVALGALAAAAGAVAVGAWAANKGLDAASKSAKNIWDNMGRAKAQGKTVDELADRDALRDQLFGEKAEGFENRLPRLLTDQKRKKGILGDKGIFGTLGLDKKTMAEMEKKGEADATGVLTRIADKRFELEDKINAAKTPKQKAALEQKLRQFDKSFDLFAGKPLADAVRGLPKGEAKKFKDELKQVSDAFDEVVPKTTPKQLEQQAAAMQRAEFIRDQIAKKRDEAIGRITTPAAARFQEAKNAISAQLSPIYSQIVGNIGRLALDAGTALLKMIPVDKLKAAGKVVGDYLKNLKVENIGAELGKLKDIIWNGIRGAIATPDQTIWEGLKERFKEGLKSAWDNQKAVWTDVIGPAIGEGIKSAWQNQKDLWSGIGTMISEGVTSAIDGIKATAPNLFSGLGTAITDAVKTMINTVGQIIPGFKPFETSTDLLKREQRERDERRARGEQEGPFLPGQGPPAAPGAADQLGIGDIGNNLPQKAGEAAQTFNDAAGSGLSGKGSEAGGAFNSAVDGNSIGSAIGNTAAGIISSTTVNVKVDVSGAVTSSTSVGGGRGGGASTGTDKPSGVGSN
jgi:hypothetical protein